MGWLKDWQRKRASEQIELDLVAAIEAKDLSRVQAVLVNDRLASRNFRFLPTKALQRALEVGEPAIFSSVLYDALDRSGSQGDVLLHYLMEAISAGNEQIALTIARDPRVAVDRKTSFISLTEKKFVFRLYPKDALVQAREKGMMELSAAMEDRLYNKWAGDLEQRCLSKIATMENLRHEVEKLSAQAGAFRRAAEMPPKERPRLEPPEQECATGHSNSAEGLLKQINQARRSVPNWETSIKEFIEAEINRTRIDPCEGTAIIHRPTPPQ